MALTRVSEPAASKPAKARVIQTLHTGLTLSFEIMILVLLLLLCFVELAFTHCRSVIAQFTSPPKKHRLLSSDSVRVAQYSKNPRPQAESKRFQPLVLAEDHDEPRHSSLNILPPRTPLMRSSSSLLPETSITQHKEPALSRETAKEHNFPGVGGDDGLDIDGCLLPVAPPKRSVLYRPPNTPEDTNSPTSATVPTRRLNLDQMVHKRRRAMSHQVVEANLRATRQEGSASNTLPIISISHKAIELQPSIVEPSLLQNPFSPPRPVAHIELPHRRVSENLTRDNQPALRSAEDDSLELSNSLSYLRTLAKTKKGTAGSAGVTSKRSRSHRNFPNTSTPSGRTPNMET